MGRRHAAGRCSCQITEFQTAQINGARLNHSRDPNGVMNMKPRRGFAQKFEAGLATICVCLLTMMSIVVIVQVCSRYIFNYSFVWAEELVRYLMIWMVMVGSALVQMKNEHIRIDFFPALAGPRGRRIMEIFFRLCTLIFLTIIAYKGVKVSYFNRLFESSGLRINMIWPSLAIPLGAILIGGYTLAGLTADVIQLFTWPKERLAEFDQKLQLERYQTTSEHQSATDQKEH